MPWCQKIDNVTLSGKCYPSQFGSFTMLFGGLLMMLAGLLGMISVDITSPDDDGDDQSQIS